jgi:hypothetical protein
MTDREQLAALVARCEAATGEDRDLDYAIAAAVGWPDSPIMHQNARRYTASLDAAVTLVPNGWYVYSVADFAPDVPGWRCGLRRDNDGALVWSNDAHTEAHARAAAALRARMDETNG